MQANAVKLLEWFIALSENGAPGPTNQDIAEYLSNTSLGVVSKALAALVKSGKITIRHMPARVISITKTGKMLAPSKRAPITHRVAKVTRDTPVISIRDAIAARSPPSGPAPIIGGCKFISGDPIIELRAKRSPYCDAKRIEGSSYCREHHNICWTGRRAKTA